MSGFLLVSALSVFLIQFIVSLICLFLYTRTQEKFLRSWALAFTFGSARYGVDAVIQAFEGSAFLVILELLLVFLNILFVLYGAYEVKEKNKPSIIVFLFSVLLIWTIWLEFVPSIDPLFQAIPLSFAGAVIYFYAGLSFYRIKTTSMGRYLVSVPLLIGGVYKLLVPFASSFMWFAAAGYSLAFFLTVLISLGFLIYYFQTFFSQYIRTSNFFRMISERSDDIVFHFKTYPVKKFEFISSSVRSVTGYYPNYFYADSALVWELMSPEDKNNLRKLINSGRSEPVIIRFRTKYYERIWLEIRVNAETDSRGKVLSIDGVARNVSERMNYEQKLAESEERYRLLFDFSSAIKLVIRVDDGVIWDANVTACEFYGYSKEELRQKNISDLNIAQDSEGLKTLNEITRRDGHAHFFLKGRISTGDIRDIEIYTSYIKISCEEYLYAVIHDITEEFQAREALAESEKKYREKLEETVKERTRELKKSEEMFRKVAESSQDSIILYDRDLNILYMNPHVEAKNPYIKKEKIIKYLPEASLPEDINKQIEYLFRKIIETGKDAKNEVNMRDGRVVEFISTPVLNEGTGEIDMLLSYGRDITERKKLEETIVAALEREKELNSLKSKLISTVSHEFRTPMAAILSSAELLERYGRKWDIEKYNEHIARIRLSINNLTALVDDVLSLGKVESKKIDFKPSEFDLSELCDNIMQEIYLLAGENHQIKLQINTKQEKYILDERLFRLIFTNILSNAVKYSPGGGEVIFSINESSGFLNFSISDQGIGIPEESFKSLYEPFSRGANVKDIPGTGLGLSIVKLAVDIWQGNISVNSELKKGTTIIINLPIITGAT
jgi:PAS domain S-box-containing protein